MHTVWRTTTYHTLEGLPAIPHYLQVGYVSSWSAYVTYKSQHPDAPDPLHSFTEQLKEATAQYLRSLPSGDEGAKVLPQQSQQHPQGHDLECSRHHKLHQQEKEVQVCKDDGMHLAAAQSIPKAVATPSCHSSGGAGTVAGPSNTTVAAAAAAAGGDHDDAWMDTPLTITRNLVLLMGKEPRQQ